MATRRLRATERWHPKNRPALARCDTACIASARSISPRAGRQRIYRRPECHRRTAVRTAWPPATRRIRRRIRTHEGRRYPSQRRMAPRVAQQATTSIPIVIISDDVEGAGLIASLSRPGANTTGLTILSPELSAKSLEVLNEVVPGLSRVAALWDPTTGRSQVAMTE